MAPIIRATIELLLGYGWSIPHPLNTQSLSQYDGLSYSTVEADPSGPRLSVISWGPQRVDAYGNEKTSGSVRHKFWDGYQWNPSGLELEPLGTQAVSPTAAISAGPSLVDIFAIDSEGNLQQKYWDGYQWQPPALDWRNLTDGGLLNHDLAPTVTSWNPGRLDIFAIGTDAKLHHKYYDGINWVPEGGKTENLGGSLHSAPAAVAWGANRFDIFAISKETSGLSHLYWDGSSWQGWEDIGSTRSLSYTPGAATWGPGRLDVFLVNSQGKLIHDFYDGSQWIEEDLSGSLEATFVGTPAVISSKGGGTSNDRIDVVVLASDKTYYYLYWDGTKWSDWSSHGGDFNSSPSINSWQKDAAQRLDIFGVKSNGQLGHQTWWGQGWYPEYDQWEELGGDLRGD
ncbi:MAG: hypothetical protein LQ351_004093 [Letrouitia transgressa]|nr:MAG: hypothetical protein LQ351_004093 [Letrouitia transgressa]